MTLGIVYHISISTIPQHLHTRVPELVTSRGPDTQISLLFSENSGGYPEMTIQIKH